MPIKSSSMHACMSSLYDEKNGEGVGNASNPHAQYQDICCQKTGKCGEKKSKKKTNESITFLQYMFHELES